MSLPWVRLDTNIASHDKILTLLSHRGGRGIAFSYLCSIAYSGLNGTDGHIPFAALPFIHATKRDMEILVEVGLLAPNPRGWTVVNYAERQQLSAATSAISETKRRASIKGNCVRHHGEECGCWQQTVA